jgi:hypothetical protein
MIGPILLTNRRILQESPRYFHPISHWSVQIGMKKFASLANFRVCSRFYASKHVVERKTLPEQEKEVSVSLISDASKQKAAGNPLEEYIDDNLMEMSQTQFDELLSQLLAEKRLNRLQALAFRKKYDDSMILQKQLADKWAGYEKGVISRIVGPVVDCRFEGKMPAIGDALEIILPVTRGERMVFEVCQHMGNGEVRTI